VSAEIVAAGAADVIANLAALTTPKDEGAKRQDGKEKVEGGIGDHKGIGGIAGEGCRGMIDPDEAEETIYAGGAFRQIEQLPKIFHT
jgi:hypothetical protein